MISDKLYIQNNDLSGVVPFKNCNQFTVLIADCADPIKVSCKCCTGCYGFYSTVPCDSNQIEITVFNTTGGHSLEYHISNMKGDANYYFEKYIWDEGLLVDNFCISPTDCFVLKLTNDTHVPFQMAISYDNKEIFNENIDSVDTELKFGYSSDNTIRMNTCDNVHICNQSFKRNTTKSMILNQFTKVRGISMSQDTSSFQFKAMCKWIEFLDKRNEDDVENDSFIFHDTYYILTTFYYYTSGENWLRNDFWISDESFCSWFGIHCDADGYVKGINLTFNKLEGVIPTEIGSFVRLEYLMLDENSLSGTIPVEMMNLISLKQLRMTNNNIIGPLPSEINLLENLVELDLSTNLLSDSVPAEIGEVTTLVILNLNNNDFSGKFPSIQHLSELKKLSLRSNLFEGQIDHLGNLSNLGKTFFSL